MDTPFGRNEMPELSFVWATFILAQMFYWLTTCVNPGFVHLPHASKTTITEGDDSFHVTQFDINDIVRQYAEYMSGTRELSAGTCVAFSSSLASKLFHHHGLQKDEQAFSKRIHEWIGSYCGDSSVDSVCEGVWRLIPHASHTDVNHDCQEFTATQDPPHNTHDNNLTSDTNPVAVDLDQGTATATDFGPRKEGVRDHRQLPLPLLLSMLHHHETTFSERIKQIPTFNTDTHPRTPELVHPAQVSLPSPPLLTDDHMCVLILCVLHTQFCPHCLIIKPTQARHCHQCGHCVARFDHRTLLCDVPVILIYT